MMEYKCGIRCWLVFLAFVFGSLIRMTDVYAQSGQINVTSFKLLENDLTANTRGTQETDFNGDVAALIKVVTTQTGFTFDNGSLGIVKVKQGVGEIWVYVPAKTQRLTIQHPQLGVLRDYYFQIPIEKAKTYELVLTTGDVRTVVSPDAGGNYLVLTVTPANAEFYIDDQLRYLNDDGSGSFFLTYGDHTYRTEFVDYITEAGVIKIGNEKVEKKISLNSSLTTLTVSVLPETAQILIDGELKGTGQWSGQLRAGTHDVRAQLKSYSSYQQTITLSQQEKRTIVIPELKSILSTLEINSITENTQIYIDDELKGTGSWIGTIDAGTHKLSAKKEGYREYSQPIELVQNNKRMITIPSLQPKYGSLRIETVPIGCDVYLDGTKLGTSPSIFSNILAYSHELRLSKAGYKDEVMTIDVVEGETKFISAKLNNYISISVNANYSGAEVNMDGEYFGTTPTDTVVIKGGTHVFSAKYGNYEAEKSVDLSQNGIVTLKLTKSKFEYVKPEEVYFGGSYSLDGSFCGIEGTIGAYVQKFNVEASIKRYMNSTNALIETLSDDSELFVFDKYGRFLGDYSFYSSRFSVRIGYGMKIFNRIRITPQVGYGFVKMNYITINGTGISPSASSVLVSTRFSLAIFPHCNLIATPEYAFMIKESDSFKACVVGKPTINGMVNGVNGNVGISIYF